MPYALTTVVGASAASNEHAMSLAGILGAKPLRAMVQFNYMVDLDWLMAQLPPRPPAPAPAQLPVLVFHGMTDADSRAHLATQQQRRWPQVRLLIPPLPIAYGVHHTKAMLLFAADDTLRVVIGTANLIERDWTAKTQGVWMSPWLPRKRRGSGPPPSPAPSSAPLPASAPARVPETCAFEHELLAYLAQYGPVLRTTRSRLQGYDFSACAPVQLIASVPGYWQHGDLRRWGHPRLADLLSRLPPPVAAPASIGNAPNPVPQIIAQCSSIGSFDEAWLEDEFGASLRRAPAAPQDRGRPHAPLALIYPTRTDVRDSLEGWSGGDSLPFRQALWAKQRAFMHPRLHRWHARRAGRHRALPHIKTYAQVRVAGPHLQTDWFVLTSANLSKAAWGVFQKQRSQLMIRSYELGVLFPPELLDVAPVERQTPTARAPMPVRSLPSPIIVSDSEADADADADPKAHPQAEATAVLETDAAPPSDQDHDGRRAARARERARQRAQDDGRAVREAPVVIDLTDTPATPRPVSRKRSRTASPHASPAMDVPHLQPFQLPYDVPLVPYSACDEAYTCDGDGSHIALEIV